MIESPNSAARTIRAQATAYATKMPIALSAKQRAAPRTHTDRVRQRLADEIISGALRPGWHLDEKALAERFKVSRTPVREALRQLAANDLVEWRPHQGAIVATITIPKMIEMFEVMAEVEGLCGRLAARRMTPDERKDLLVRHKRCEPYIQANDKEGYLAMNKPFHEAIYHGTHNGYLFEHAQSLYNRLAPYRAYQLNRPGQLPRSFDEHQEIVNAITDGDGDAAYRLLRDHVTLDGELFGDLIASLNARPSTPIRART
jgi:DNA-binding GntR family transcriptional regulator